MASPAISCHWKIFRPKYIFQKIFHSIFLVYVLIFNGMCSQGKSSRPQMFYKIGVLKNFAIFSEKHHRKTPLLLKRDSNTGVFLRILQFLRTHFSTEHLRWLLLPVIECATDVQELNI